MISIITPDDYNTISWKNGLGETTELAISEGGSVEDFDWRISIASVEEDGPFSDFSGYLRNLVLIDGIGIELKYDQSDKTDQLYKLMDTAEFDGGCKAEGVLRHSSIRGFNLMTKSGVYRADLKCYTKRQTAPIESCELCYIFCVKTEATLFSTFDASKKVLPPNHLMRIESPTDGDLAVNGNDMIVVQLFKL